MNRSISKQRIANCWGEGLINNWFRLFIAYLQLKDSPFDAIFLEAVLLFSDCIRRNGLPPVTLEQMMDRKQLYHPLIDY